MTSYELNTWYFSMTTETNLWLMNENFAEWTIMSLNGKWENRATTKFMWQHNTELFTSIAVTTEQIEYFSNREQHCIESREDKYIFITLWREQSDRKRRCKSIDLLWMGCRASKAHMHHDGIFWLQILIDLFAKSWILWGLTKRDKCTWNKDESIINLSGNKVPHTAFRESIIL